MVKHNNFSEKLDIYNKQNEMDKNIIKNHLSNRFLSEEVTPGIKVTAAMNKESGKINKAGVTAVGKDVSSYEEEKKVDDKGMPVNKYNYTDDAEKTYHDELEIMNGQEMIEYNSEPGEDFKQRAEEAIAGSARMGNDPTWANVIPKQKGFTGPDFGKNLVKSIQDSNKKRAEAEIQTYGMGDVQIPTGQKVQTAQIAVGGKSPKGDATKLKENNNKSQIKEGMKRLKFKKEFKGVGNALKMIPESYRTDNKEFEMTDGNETYKIRWEGTLTEGRAIVLAASDKSMVNEDMQKMKHLMGYKSSQTLGLVKGNSRLDENSKFTDILAKTKILLEGGDIESVKAKTGNLEDIKKKAPEATKHVEGSVSKDKGTQAPAAKEGDLDDAVSHAPEAKKHVEGSVSTEKGTKAPSPKKGEWENVKKKSADATKHVTMKESFQSDEDAEVEDAENEEETAINQVTETEGGDIEGTKAANGEWEKIKVPHAAEAKKHIHMGKESTAKVETEAKEEAITEGITLGGIRFEPINESYFEEGMSEEFIPHGTYTLGNSGGYEIMLSDDGDAAKVRDAYGSDNPKTTDWLPIEYVPNEDGEMDEEGYPEMEPVIDPNGYNIPLNMVMRINR